jgi:hypothetical protein
MLTVAGVLAAFAVASSGPALTLQDPAISESSGLATSSYDSSFVLTHNDSGGKPEYFVVDTRTGKTAARVSVPGATNVDWEDIAVSGHTVYLADIGDNAARRRSVTLYAVGERSTARATATTLTYDDGPHDAEALLVPPGGRPRFVVTKRLLGAGVYRVAGSHLVHVADLDTGLVTGGSWSPDGTRIALVSYTGIAVYDAAAWPAGSPARYPLPPLRQAESVTWHGNTALYVGSEGVHSPVYRVDVGAATPAGSSARATTATSASSTASSSGTSSSAASPAIIPPPRDGVPPAPAKGLSAGIAAVVAVLALLAVAGTRVLRRRRGGLG